MRYAILKKQNWLAGENRSWKYNTNQFPIYYTASDFHPKWKWLSLWINTKSNFSHEDQKLSKSLKKNWISTTQFLPNVACRVYRLISNICSVHFGRIQK